MKKEIKIKYKIGVIGKAGRSKGIPEKLRKAAEVVGKEIATQGCILVTGACMGVSHIAAKAASDKKGLILGYSPAKNLKTHIEPPISYPYPPENMELIFTGWGKVGRNVLSISECDGIICIGGGMGTLNEFSIAAHEGKIIGILTGLGGFVEKILPEIENQVPEKAGAILIKDKNPRRLVKKVVQEIQKRKEEIRKEIPITFKNKKGEQLVGIFHLPYKEKPPLVVLIHGFGSSKTRRRFVRLARVLQKEGIAVFRFDFAGCGDSEGKLEETTIKKQIDDLDSALKAIFKEADLDPNKIVFVAESLGAIVGVLYKNRFNIPLKTIVFWAPAFCQKKLLGGWYTEEQMRKCKKRKYLTYKDKKIGWEYLKENINKDYTHALKKINLPILILHGRKDQKVPIEFSKKLAKTHKNIKLIELDTNHKFEDYYSQQKLIRETVRWIKKYLKI